MRPSPSAGEEAVLRELETVLPSIAAVLDAVIDSAAGARPGLDADAYAQALRALAKEVEAAQAALTSLLSDPAARAPTTRSKPFRRMSSAA
jgi:hypothetical protein